MKTIKAKVFKPFKKLTITLQQDWHDFNIGLNIYYLITKYKSIIISIHVLFWSIYFSIQLGKYTTIKTITKNIDTSAFKKGDMLYLDPDKAGALTKVPPTVDGRIYWDSDTGEYKYCDTDIIVPNPDLRVYFDGDLKTLCTDAPPPEIAEAFEEMVKVVREKGTEIIKNINTVHISNLIYFDFFDGLFRYIKNDSAISLDVRNWIKVNNGNWSYVGEDKDGITTRFVIHEGIPHADKVSTKESIKLIAENKVHYL